MMTLVLIRVMIACWIIFVGYWAWSVRGIKPAAERQSWLSSMAHKAPLTLGGLLLWFRALPFPLNLALTSHTDLAQAVGTVVCLAGLIMAIWSRRTLAGNWSSMVTFKKGHELVQAGPYRFVRHPIYTGILLMCLGTATMRGSLQYWVGFLILCIGFWIKLKQEESLLLRHFPDEYPSYRCRVKALIPFVI